MKDTRIEMRDSLILQTLREVVKNNKKASSVLNDFLQALELNLNGIEDVNVEGLKEEFSNFGEGEEEKKKNKKCVAINTRF